MPAITIALAEEVKDYIAGEAYSEAVTVERVNVPIHKLEDIPDMTDSPLVTIYPGEHSIVQAASRVESERNYVVVVLLREKTKRGLTDALIIQRQDELIGLAEEIEQSLELVGFTIGAASVRPLSVSGSVAGDNIPLLQTHAAEYNEFAAVISVTYVTVI